MSRLIYAFSKGFDLTVDKVIPGDNSSLVFTLCTAQCCKICCMCSDVLSDQCGFKKMYFGAFGQHFCMP